MILEELSVQFKRGGKDFILKNYVDTSYSPARMYFYYESLQVDDKTQQPVIISYNEVLFKFHEDGDGRSYMGDIHTRITKNHLTAAGKVIKSEAEPESMKSNAKDKTDFFLSPLKSAIVRFMANGVIRKMKVFSWSNFQPLFKPDGSTNPDSIYNTEMEGYTAEGSEGSYNTHNADGTAISGATSENIDIVPWRSGGVQ